MTYASASYSYPSAERLNKTAIIKRFLRESGLGFYGTATGGTTTTVVDTVRMKDGGLNNDFAEGWTYILKDAGGAAAAPEGEIQPISSFAVSTGTVTNGTLTTAVGAGDEYAIFTVLHPNDVLDHLTELLTSEIYLPAWTLLSEVPDGDMEQAGTTDWTADNATLAKASTEPAMNGARWLSVEATSTNGAAQSVAIGIQPGKRYQLSALARTNGATDAKLAVVDAADSSEIESITYSAMAAGRIYFDFTAPSDCMQIYVKLTTVTNGQTTYWDDVCLYAVDSLELPAPWWVKDGDQVQGVFELRPQNVSTGVWDAALRGERDVRWDIRDEAFGRGQLRFVARQGYLRGFPLFIKGTRNETAFTNNNTDYKHLDPNLVNAGLCYKAFSQLASYRHSGSLNMEWIKQQRSEWKDEWEHQKRSHLARLEEDTTSVPPDRLHYRRPDGTTSVLHWERLVR